MPFAGFALILAALVGGCAPSAPDTLTPHRPTSAEQENPPPDDPTKEPPPTAGEGPAADPGGGSTVQGRGEKVPVDTDELIGFGDELTAALESGDVEQWLALTTLEDEARQQQRDWFAGVQAVPMDLREFHPTWLIERDVEGEVHGPLVEFTFRHQVSGVDALPTVELYDFTLERIGTDGPYRMVEVSGSDSPDSAYPQLWDLHPIEVVETEHAVLIGEEDSDLADLAEAVDLGAAAVLDQFPVEGVERMSVTVVNETLVATVLGESEEGAFAGFAVPVAASAFVEEDGNLPNALPTDDVGARLVIDQEYSQEEWDHYDEPAGGLPLMRHEGLHLAMMLRQPGGVGPRWAIEGFAGWFEVVGDKVVLETHEDWYSLSVGPDTVPDSLPPSDYEDFVSGDFIDRNYLDAANVFLYVEETYSTDQTIALGEDLHGLNMWIDGEEGIGPVLTEHLGVDLATFEQGFVDWSRETYGD